MYFLLPAFWVWLSCENAFSLYSNYVTSASYGTRVDDLKIRKLEILIILFLLFCLDEGKIFLVMVLVTALCDSVSF